MKDLKQITVRGTELLSGSIALGVLQSFRRMNTVGCIHRVSTGSKAGQSAIATEVAGSLKSSVSNTDPVILATPIYTFENIFDKLTGELTKLKTAILKKQEANESL